MRIEPVAADDPPERLRAWHALAAAVAAEESPADPPLPYRVAIGRLYPDGGEQRRSWVALDAEVAHGGVRLDLPAGANAHLANLVLGVRPLSRRRGLGGRLLATALEAARADGRTVAVGEVRVGSAGEPFAAAAGARPVQSLTRSLLRLADLDRQQVDRLAGGDGTRVNGYRLRRWVGRCPDEYVDAYATAMAGMNDAPVGELDWRPEIYDAERVRGHETAVRRRGERLYAVVAQAAGGELAGLTEVTVGDGPRAEQGDTTVVAGHRGRGLGRWVKATMLQWLGTAEPELAEVETWNATDNRHMREVNTALGFRPVESWQEWQLELRSPGEAEPAKASPA